MWITTCSLFTLLFFFFLQRWSKYSWPETDRELTGLCLFFGVSGVGQSADDTVFCPGFLCSHMSQKSPFPRSDQRARWLWQITCTHWCSNSFTSTPQRLFCDHKAPHSYQLASPVAKQESPAYPPPPTPLRGAQKKSQTTKTRHDHRRPSEVKHVSLFFLMLLCTTYYLIVPLCRPRRNILLYWKLFLVCITHTWFNLLHPSCILQPTQQVLEVPLNTWQKGQDFAQAVFREANEGIEQLLHSKGSCLSYADLKWYPVNNTQFTHFVNHSINNLAQIFAKTIFLLVSVFFSNQK